MFFFCFLERTDLMNVEPFVQLFCPVSSREEKSRTMSSLRHRVLPPQILLKCPKEASFCLWLLHPEPSCRPSMRFVLSIVHLLLLNGTKREVCL